MNVSTRVILASPAEFLSSAVNTDFDSAHMIYRIGRGMRLYRADVPQYLPGSVMSIDDGGFSGAGSFTGLAAEIIRECVSLKYSGILLDFTEKSSGMAAALTEKLSAMAARRGVTLYVPRWLDKHAPYGKVLINTLISSGSLPDLLKRCVSLYGKDRVAADIQCASNLFTLPTEDKSGKKLTFEELSRLRKKHPGSFFFSEELYSYYFTFREDGKTSFALYDNSESVNRKLSLINDMGIGEAFLLYPEVARMINGIKAPSF